MNCPRDGTELQSEGFWKYPRSKCPRCEGYFLGHRDAMETVGSQRVVALPAGKLQCPHDGAPMRVFTHKLVELDICAECGSVWLDGGELKKVGEKKSADDHEPVGTFVQEAIDGVLESLTDDQ